MFLIGDRQGQIIMARLRMRCSNLNGHLFALNIIDSPVCRCGFVNEDEFHFFFICPFYYRQRVTLQNYVSTMAPMKLNVLLYGSDDLDFSINKEIITKTLLYIKATGRFEE